MHIVCLILFLNVCRATILRQFFSPYLHYSSRFAYSQLKNESDEDGPGQPLLLTELLDRPDEAMNVSLVQPSLGGIKSYAGFLTVDASSKSHLYFWFVPRTEPEQTPAPLILWLQGGPGCSSLFGMFAENGPFAVTEDGLGLEKREYAWTNEYHMLYIDQPVGTGFSFTEDEEVGYHGSAYKAGEHLMTALDQFFRIYMHMLKRDFYIAGESYAAKYIPHLAHKIHTTKFEDGRKIRFKGMMIGNGFSDPANVLTQSEQLYGLGLIGREHQVILKRIERETAYSLKSEKWSEVSERFDYLMNSTDVFRDVSVYDYTKNEGDTDFQLRYVQFLAQNHVRRSIHAGGIWYEKCSPIVFHHFEEDLWQSIRDRVEELLKYHYPILYYNGQFDLLCSYPNSEKFLRSLRWSGALEYGFAKRQYWRVDGKLAGFYRTGSNLAGLLVRNAGHMVPSDQPKIALELVRAFIAKKFHPAL